MTPTPPPPGGRIPVKLHHRVSLILTEDAVLAEELLARKKLAAEVAGRLAERVLLVRPGRADAAVSANFLMVLSFHLAHGAFLTIQNLRLATCPPPID